MKATLLGILGLVGAAIVGALGGWDTALQTLIIFMAIDYFSGLIVAAAFKASPKSENGALESRAGLKGLLRKMAMLCAVLMSYYLDQVAGTDIVRDAACIAFICNEAISIIENFGLMGIPIPPVIINAIDALSSDKGGETDGEA